MLHPDLRDYQQKIVNEITEVFSDNHQMVVLAAAPNSGKTEISIAIIIQYLKMGQKVLVLPHATNVLKSQFFERAEKYGICNNENLLIEIPQNVKDVGKFDVVIVDEAHEWFYADSVQRILDITQPSKILCLTATPSVFIKKKNEGNSIHIVFKPMNELPPKFFAPLTLHLSSSDSDITKDNYDLASDELKSNYAWTKNTVESDIKELVGSVLNHIKTVHKDDTPFVQRMVNKGKELFSSFSYLEKTLIACHNTAQADYVAKFLNDNGIKTVMSGYESDVESVEIDNFKNDPEILVLIVIRRGILGFDMPAMRAVVDMTASMNINRIYQLLCRVVRQHPEGKPKLFIKVANKNMRDYTHAVTCTALALADRRALEMFDGRLTTAPALEYRQREKRELSEPKERSNDKRFEEAGIEKKDLLQLMEVLNVPDFFEQADQKYGEGYVVYGKTTLHSVKCALLGLKEKDSKKRKQEIKEFFKREGRFPSAKSNNSEEKNLRMCFQGYCTKSNNAYDQEFAVWARENGYRLQNGVISKKQEIKEFFEKEGRFPSRNAASIAEIRLYGNLISYVSKLSKMYDSEFHLWCKKNGYGSQNGGVSKKQEIKEFFEKEGRLPKWHHKSRMEKNLNACLSNYARECSKNYDPEFAAWAKKNGYNPHTGKIKKQEIKEFFEKEGRFPSKNSVDLKEKKLSNALGNYSCKSSTVYDPEFDKWARENGHGKNKTVELRKQEIKEFFEKEGRFPSQSSKNAVEKKLSGNLASYCGESSRCYDMEFNSWARENGYSKRLKKKQP